MRGNFNLHFAPGCEIRSCIPRLQTQDACVSRQTGWPDIVPLWITGCNNWVRFWTKNSIRTRVHFPCQGEQDSLRRQIARYANDASSHCIRYTGKTTCFAKIAQKCVALPMLLTSNRMHLAQIKGEAQTRGYIQICAIDRKLTRWEYYLIRRDLGSNVSIRR